MDFQPPLELAIDLSLLEKKLPCQSQPTEITNKNSYDFENNKVVSTPHIIKANNLIIPDKSCMDFFSQLARPPIKISLKHTFFVLFTVIARITFSNVGTRVLADKFY